MEKKELIKKILELGQELEKAEGLKAILVVDEMYLAIDEYTKKVPRDAVSYFSSCDGNCIINNTTNKCLRCGCIYDENNK